MWNTSSFGSPISASGRAFLYAIASFLLLFDAVAGPLRFYAGTFGIEAIVYLPKLLALVVFSSALILSPQPKTVWVSVVVIALSGIVALANSVSFSAMAFGIFLISPLLLGLITPLPKRGGPGLLFWSFGLLWTITVIGIFLDVFLDFPWKGTALELFGTSIESSRSWSTMGLERPAGFTRLSAAAAFYSGITGTLLWVLAKRTWVRTLIISATLAAVVVTTNKSAVAGMIVVLVFTAFRRVYFAQWAMLASLVIVTIVLPLSTSTNEYDFDLRDDLDVALMASLEDRLVNTWPNFIDAISVPMIGEGLGGIGTPSKEFSTDATKSALSVADNAALYLMGWLGAIGCIVFGWLGLKTYRLATIADGWRNAVGMVGVFILACSLTTDMFEATIASFMLGMLIRTGSPLKPNKWYRKKHQLDGPASVSSYAS